MVSPNERDFCSQLFSLDRNFCLFVLFCLLSFNIIRCIRCLNEWRTIIIDFLSIWIFNRIKSSNRIQNGFNLRRTKPVFAMTNRNMFSNLSQSSSKKGLFILHFTPFPRYTSLNLSRRNSQKNDQKRTELHSFFCSKFLFARISESTENKKKHSNSFRTNSKVNLP